MTDSPIIPGAHVVPLDARGNWRVEWYRFLRDLARHPKATAEQSAEISKLADRVSALEVEGDPTKFFGIGSLLVTGPYEDGSYKISLRGDSSEPGPTWYYGTGTDGVRGFYALSDAFLVADDELTKSVDVDGVTTFGLADVPDAGGGTLQKTDFDDKGRKTGSSPATTDDLPEGDDNLYYTDDRADARVAIGIAAHVAEADPHPQYLTAAEGDAAYDPVGAAASALSSANAHSDANDAITLSAAESYADGKVVDSIADGDTTHAPSRNAVFDALATKADDSGVVHTSGTESIGGAKTFDWQVVINPDPSAAAGTAAIQINDVGGNTGRIQSDSPNSFSYVARRYGGTVSLPTAVAGGAEIFSLSSVAHDGVSMPNATAILTFFTDGLQSSTNHGSYATLRMTPNGSITRAEYYRISPSFFRPGTDNAQSNGQAANRWSVVYAGTGTINTSDAREKTDVLPLTDDELTCAKALGKEIGTYKFLAMIEAKGASARTHVGMTVQRCIEVMQQHGLDPFAYGFVCYDAWEAEYEPIYESVDGIDDKGNHVWYEIDTGEMRCIRAAGDRYSFRMSELYAFIAAGQRARLDDLEARLAALELA